MRWTMPRISPGRLNRWTSPARTRTSAWRAAAPAGRRLSLPAAPDRHRQALEIILVFARHPCRVLGIAAGDGIDDRLVAFGDLEEVEPVDEHGDRGAGLDLQGLPDVEQQP